MWCCIVSQTGNNFPTQPAASIFRKRAISCMHPRFPHVAYFYEDEGKRFLKKKYVTICQMLWLPVWAKLWSNSNSEIICSIMKPHTLGPFWFLILVRPQSQLNKMFSKTPIIIKEATQSKKEYVLFSFQTQLQGFAISTWGDF